MFLANLFDNSDCIFAILLGDAKPGRYEQKFISLYFLADLRYISLYLLDDLRYKYICIFG